MADSIAFDTFRTQKFFGSLNGLRFLCIVAVMWHHSPGNRMIDGFRVLERGYVGVDFFFVLSGFLITTLLLREEAQRGRFSLPQFYWRRILRIVPIYFLIVTGISAYYVLVKGVGELAGLVPYYYLFVANFLNEDIPLLSITWSLSVEEQFYLIWPALLLLLPARVMLRGGVLFVLILLCIAATTGLLPGLAAPFARTEHATFALPAASYSAILIGAFSAVLLSSRRGFALLYAITGWAWAPVAAFIALGIALQVLPIGLAGWPHLVVHGLMALCLISIVVREDHVLRPVLMFRPIARVGEISYGLYLVHLIGLHLASVLVGWMGIGAPANFWAVTLIFPLIAIAIAEISFRTYESYFLSFKSLRLGWRPADNT